MKRNFGLNFFKVFSVLDILWQEMNVLLFLFGYFLLNFNSSFLLFLNFELLGFLLSLFFLFLNSFLLGLSNLLHFPLPGFLFFNKFPHFSFMLILGQNVRNVLLRLFIGKLLVEVGEQFQMFNSSGFFFVNLHLFWGDFHSGLLFWRFEKSGQVLRLFRNFNLAVHDVCDNTLVYRSNVDFRVYSMERHAEELFDLLALKFLQFLLSWLAIGSFFICFLALLRVIVLVGAFSGLFLLFLCHFGIIKG